MFSAGVAKLKAALSQYLTRVKRGEEVVITEHGRPIAKLVPYQTRGAFTEQRQYLARAGIIELGAGKLSAHLLRPSPVPDPTGLLHRALTEDREASW